MTRHIHLIQCLCPQRHAILAVFYDDMMITPGDAVDGFRDMVELAISQNVINRRCDICRTETVFHYEDALTNFETIQAAGIAGAVLEAKQLEFRREYDAGRN